MLLVKYFLTRIQPVICQLFLTAGFVLLVTTSVRAEPIIPNPIVALPGYSVEDAANSVSYDPATGKYSTNALGYYINAVYNLLLIGGAIIAITMIVIAGVQYTLAQGDTGRVQKAKEKIKNAIIGIVIMLLAYNIVLLLDPRAVLFYPLDNLFIDKQEDSSDSNTGEPDGTDNDSSYVGAEGDLVTLPIKGTDFYSATSSVLIASDVLKALELAAAEYKKATGHNLKITSAARSLEKQASLFVANCPLKNGLPKCKVQTCDPTGRADSETFNSDAEFQEFVLTQGVIESCPHTSGVALDIWPDTSLGNFQASTYDMSRMISALTQNGFCRLKSEAWHFELDVRKMSNSCSTSNSDILSRYPEALYCATFDFDDRCCISPANAYKRSDVKWCGQ